MTDMQHAAPVGSIWVHLKTGGVYTVIGHCVIEATMTDAVLYQAPANLVPWARPAEEFLDGRFQRMRIGDHK